MKRKGGILYPLLIMALAVNTTMSLVLLANRGKLESPSRVEAEPVAAANKLTALDPETAMTDTRSEAISEIPSRSERVARGATDTPKPRRRVKSRVSPKRSENGEPVKVNTTDHTSEERAGKEDIVFLPKPVLYRVTRSTILVTRQGQRIFLPKGTTVTVAGLAQSGTALVVSRHGNPEGFVPGWAIEEEVRDEEAPSSLNPSGVSGSSANSRIGEPLSPLPTPRISVGPYGGSVGLGPAYIFIGRDGRMSGSFSR